MEMRKAPGGCRGALDDECVWRIPDDRVVVCECWGARPARPDFYFFGLKPLLSFFIQLGRVAGTLAGARLGLTALLPTYYPSIL